jgi:hypothetical protein
MLPHRCNLWAHQAAINVGKKVGWFGLSESSKKAAKSKLFPREIAINFDLNCE